ncbi:MAG: protein-tyrosine-phosphatase [Mycobacterium sp.]|nr:protein-tyrosine-phosphatase [Mycobacterium sp.]
MVRAPRLAIARPSARNSSSTSLPKSPPTTAEPKVFFWRLTSVGLRSAGRQDRSWADQGRLSTWPLCPPHVLFVCTGNIFGGDATGFVARQLTLRIASDAHLVLTMTRTHRDAVLELAPHRLQRTFTLREAARLVSECNARNVDDLAALTPAAVVDETSDIPDPIGQSAEHFSTTGSQIAVARGAPVLQRHSVEARDGQFLDHTIQRAVRPVAAALPQLAEGTVRSGPVVLMSSTVMSTTAGVMHASMVVVGPEITVNAT